MRIFRYGKEEIPPISRVVALGFFDGMHLAHRSLIKLTVQTALKRGLTSAVFTFVSEGDVLKSNSPRLCSTDEKLKVMEEFGIEEVILADFREVANICAEDFVKVVLCQELGCKVGCLGYNFRFGKGAVADADKFRELICKEGGEALILEQIKYGSSPISSTAVRDALAKGDTAFATNMLGVPYSVSGKVERGLGLGHSFGFPTVNTPLWEDCPLRRGVYRTAVRIGEKLYTGVTNVGSCPTVNGGREVHAETYLPNFFGDLYGEMAQIYFLEFLRDEKKFQSLDELTDAIRKDAEKAIERNGDLTWQAIGLNLP